MPASPDSVIWRADPHTIAKIKLLQAYLKAWFSILGTTRRGEHLLYVDGFAGPGEYTNYPSGSPLAAIEAANSALETHRDKWIAGSVNCAFIESEAKRAQHLQRKIGQTAVHRKTRTFVYNATFIDGMVRVKQAVPGPFEQGHPVFVFIDPFGATGVPFSTVRDILSLRTAEVLINLDADGIDRILNAGESANADAHLTSLFGDDVWRKELNKYANQESRCKSDSEPLQTLSSWNRRRQVSVSL